MGRRPINSSQRDLLQKAIPLIFGVDLGGIDEYVDLLADKR